MAFYGKVGYLLRPNIFASNALNGQSSMLTAVRGMASKLFIGGLSYGTDDNSLKDAFSSFGDVIEARIITDRETGRSRGFGFVNFSTDECANSALSAMDGQCLNGRNIRVSFAQERAPRSTFGGGGGGGGYENAGGNDRF